MSTSRFVKWYSLFLFALSLPAAYAIAAADPGTDQRVATKELIRPIPMDAVTLPIGDQNQELEVVVSTPHNYDPERSYPLLVVLDADPLLGLLRTINFLWTEEGKSIPTVLVGIPFGSTASAIWGHRSYYLLPNAVGVIDYYGNSVPVNNGGGAPELAEFIHRQLLPTIAERYNIDRDRVGLAGFSMGGLFAAWHLVTHTGIFSDYLVIAPPIAPPFVSDEFEEATNELVRRGFGQPTRLYIAYADSDLAQVLTGASQWSSEWDKLADSNLSLKVEVLQGFRHDSGAIPALINGYDFLYGK